MNEISLLYIKNLTDRKLKVDYFSSSNSGRGYIEIGQTIYIYFSSFAEISIEYSRIKDNSSIYIGHDNVEATLFPERFYHAIHVDISPHTVTIFRTNYQGQEVPVEIRRIIGMVDPRVW